MPPEEGVDRFRYKEDEETPLHILLSGSRDFTVSKDNIATICSEGVLIDGDNEPTPENILDSKDVLNAPDTLNLGFEFIYPWRQNGKFPVGKARIKMVSNIRVQHMSLFDIFFQMNLMNYINNVDIPDTNKRLKYPVVLDEYLRMIACRLIMACYVDHSVRGLFSNYSIKTQKGNPKCINKIISIRHLRNITYAMSYTNLPIKEYYDPFFRQHQMEEGRNRSMEAQFDLSISQCSG